MKQMFVGREVVSEKDVFDPSTASLMTDMNAGEFGFRFTYVLPLSPWRALMEETRSAHTMAPMSHSKTRLDRTLGRLCHGVRFLSDGTSPLDSLNVASVLPKQPFLRELALSVGEGLFSKAT